MIKDLMLMTNDQGLDAHQALHSMKARSLLRAPEPM